MREVFAVIRREYLSRVKSKWFVFSTLGVPVVMAAVIAINAIASGSGSQSQRLVLVDETQADIAGTALGPLEAAGFRVEVAQGEDAERSVLEARLEEGDVGGYIVLDQEAFARGRIRLVAESQPSTIRRMVLQSVLVGAVVDARYGDSADDVTALLRGGELQIELSGQEGLSDRRLGQIYALGGSAILYFALLVYGIWLLRAVLEEKTNRTVEVILSAIRPSQLMLGKVLGVGAVGLTQIGLWVGLIAGLAAFALPALVASRPELSFLSDVSSVAPALWIVGLFLIYFLLGFLLYASLYAAAGAMCSTEQEAQQVAQPVNMMIIIPMIVMASQLSNGLEAAWVAPLSFFPLFSPILMFARAASGVAAGWEIALSMLLMMAAIWGVAWIAGRIYRVGILMQGKRPTLPELMRWVRQG